MRGKLAIALIASAVVLGAQQPTPTEGEKRLAGSLAALPTDDARRELLQREGTLVTPGLIQAVLLEGRPLVRGGKYSSALHLYQFSLGLAERVDDKSMQSFCLYACATVQRWLGDYEQALDLGTRSLAMAREAGVGPRGIADGLEVVGSALQYLGDSSGALQSEREALDLAESAGDKMRTAVIRNSVAAIYKDMGEYRLALENYGKSLALAVGPSREGRVILLNNIGTVYEAQGNLELAIDYYQKSLQLAEEIQYKGFTSEPLLNLGAVYQRMGRNQLALDYLLRALPLAEAEGDRGVIANIHLVLGNVQRAQGKLEEAWQHLETSASLFHTIHYLANESRALSRLAAIEDTRGKFAQSATLANQALELARQVGDRGALWNAAQAAAHANLRLGKRAEARAELLEAIDTIESVRGQVAGGEQDRARFFEDKVAPYNELVKLSLDDGHPNAALDFSERAKARVLLEVLRDNRVLISKTMTVEERSRERALLDRIASLNNRLKEENSSQESNRDRAARLHTQLDAMRREYEAFQSRLYASHPELPANRVETPLPSLREIAARLPDDKSVALEYVVTEESTFLFVISKRAPSLRHFSIHISSADLNAKVRRFSEKLGRRDLDFGPDAQELYRLLVAPAEEALREKTTIVIVPDGVLWQLPFQALATASDRYLVERSSIFYAPSLTVLSEMLRRHPPGRQPRSLTVMAVGNPAGPAASLPEAETEVNALREIYGAANSTILVGEEASEATFKHQASKFAILHVAAHAVLDDRSPLYSHLVLSPGRGSNEDGMLEAREMMDLDLKAEVVVLSACETARGRLGGGEGLIGMTWALFIAGSPATVATSWKIDSASAARFTVEFHRRLKEGLSKAAAMRQAALAVMRLPGYRHPYYWSSFSLVGQGF